MRVAFVHDWLVTYAGAERVLEQMLFVYPEASVYTLVDFLPKNSRSFLGNSPVHTSFLQKLPFARRKYRSYLPLMPLAVEQFDLSDYDLVISSSHAVAKGVLTGPDQVHICMCYSPIRYAWDLQHQYLRESGITRGIKSMLARGLLHYVRIWDTRTASGVDYFISISNFIARRVRKTYGRNSTVIYPPVDTDAFLLNSNTRDDFYITCSRMVPYKRIDLIVDAFSRLMPEKKLIVVGDGPEFPKIKGLAGPNIMLLGKAPFSELVEYLGRAKGFIFAAEEDFGIAPLEAQSCGTPVIAYGKGGALETVIGIESDQPTGFFFYEQSAEALAQAITGFEKSIEKITAENCRRNALRFSILRFRREFQKFASNLFREGCS
ncbi:MAG TPA: glycosyl transferase family 1 [Halieaceae bacterium]|nr:glycosyl transferase family 1 [Halieaceae bacterium]